MAVRVEEVFFQHWLKIMRATIAVSVLRDKEPDRFRLNYPAVLYSFFFNHTATTEIYTLSLHDALPICNCPPDSALGLTPTSAARIFITISLLSAARSIERSTASNISSTTSLTTMSFTHSLRR